jgi:integrase
LEEFAPRFIRGHAKANQQKPSGIDAKESILKHHLLPALGHKRLDEITNEDIASLLATFAAGIPDGQGGFKIKPSSKVKTINNRLTVLAKLLRVAVEWKVIPRMPCAIKILKVPEGELPFYEHDIYDRLVEAARKVDPRAAAVVLLGGDAGLRRGEIIALFQTDVDFHRHQLVVQRSSYKGKLGPTKSGKIRTIPMTKALESVLKSLRHLRGERVLYRDDGSPTTPKKVRMWMQQVERRAGLPDTGAVHILRHYADLRVMPTRFGMRATGHGVCAAEVLADAA